MKISKKSAVRIASLYNSIDVAEQMMRDDKSVENRNLWKPHELHAVLNLRAEFGIDPPAYRDQSDDVLRMRIAAFNAAARSASV